MKPRADHIGLRRVVIDDRDVEGIPGREAKVSTIALIVDADTPLPLAVAPYCLDRFAAGNFKSAGCVASGGKRVRGLTRRFCARGRAEAYFAAASTRLLSALLRFPTAGQSATSWCFAR